MGKIKQFIEFLRHGVWQDHHERKTGDGGKKTKWYIRPSRILIYTIRGLGEHGVGVQAAALTFFTLMAIVPVLAVIFAIGKGFGMQETLIGSLYEMFGQYRSLLDIILEMTQNMLEVRTSGGLIAGVGVAILLWAIIQVFGNIEKAFNNIWEVKKSRPIKRKVVDYISVIILAPVFWIISRNFLSSIRDGLEPYAWSWLLDGLFGFLAILFMCMVFAVIYYVMPNTRVKFKGALVAGLIAGTLFWLFQEGYTYLQRYLTNYNLIYGSFVAIPLFLIWLQWSWMILLVGAELSFAYQNISKYELERESASICYDLRRKVLLATMVTIAKHYLENKGPVDSGQVADELDMPVRMVRDVIFDLENAGLVVTVQNADDDRRHYFMPAQDVHSLSVFDVINGVECSADAPANLRFHDNAKIEKVSRLMDGIKAGGQGSPYNVKISELIE